MRAKRTASDVVTPGVTETPSPDAVDPEQAKIQEAFARLRAGIEDAPDDTGKLAVDGDFMKTVIALL